MPSPTTFLRKGSSSSPTDPSQSGLNPLPNLSSRTISAWALASRTVVLVLCKHDWLAKACGPLPRLLPLLRMVFPIPSCWESACFVQGPAKMLPTLQSLPCPPVHLKLRWSLTALCIHIYLEVLFKCFHSFIILTTVPGTQQTFNQCSLNGLGTQCEKTSFSGTHNKTRK